MEQEPFNPILDYHRRIMEKDPIAGRELVRLNEVHIKKALGILNEDGKTVMPVKAVRQLKKKKKRR